jgi:hypothetical protein
MIVAGKGVELASTSDDERTPRRDAVHDLEWPAPIGVLGSQRYSPHSRKSTRSLLEGCVYLYPQRAVYIGRWSLLEHERRKSRGGDAATAIDHPGQCWTKTAVLGVSEHIGADSSRFVSSLARCLFGEGRLWAPKIELVPEGLYGGMMTRKNHGKSCKKCGLQRKCSK